MKIILNETPIDIDGLTAETTLVELLDGIEDSLQGSGATVVEIVAGEKIYSPEQLDELEDIKVLEFEQIEFRAATAQEMVRLAIEDGGEGLQHLEDMAIEISADLRIGKVKEAMDSYIEMVDGIEWFVIMVKNADRAFASAMAESSLESERQTLISRIEEQMNSIHQMQESEDWVGMADVLEYEFPEIFSEGRNLFDKLLEASKE